MLVLRSQQVSNSPELIRRLGSIAMNTVSHKKHDMVVIIDGTCSQWKWISMPMPILPWSVEVGC